MAAINKIIVLGIYLLIIAFLTADIVLSGREFDVFYLIPVILMLFLYPYADNDIKIKKESI
ncbi:MAG TPA: hypothetical protein ENN55_05655, partial [Firmicutes bacterium]|nr:hypothetical protein [Bacillota bacterium]